MKVTLLCSETEELERADDVQDEHLCKKCNVVSSLTTTPNLHPLTQVVRKRHANRKGCAKAELHWLTLSSNGCVRRY